MPKAPIAATVKKSGRGRSFSDEDRKAASEARKKAIERRKERQVVLPVAEDVRVVWDTTQWVVEKRSGDLWVGEMFYTDFAVLLRNLPMKVDIQEGVEEKFESLSAAWNEFTSVVEQTAEEIKGLLPEEES